MKLNAKFKTTMIAIATTVLSTYAMGGETITKNYQKAAKKKWLLESKKTQQQFEVIAKKAAPYRLQYQKLFEEKYPNLLPKIMKKAKQIKSSRLTSKKKADQLEDLLKKHEDQIQSIRYAMLPSARAFRSEMATILRAYQCLFDLFFNIVCSENEQPDIVIEENLVFDAPYSDFETQISSTLLGFGDADANGQTGSVLTDAVAVDAGSHFAKAGMLETVTVPPSIDRVKVNVTIQNEHEMIAFAIFGVTGGEAKAYLDVFGDNQFRCESSSVLGWVMAPVLFYAAGEGQLTRTLTCEFTPNQDGGEYVVAGGVLSSVYAALPAATVIANTGHVLEMQVEFINE